MAELRIPFRSRQESPIDGRAARRAMHDIEAALRDGARASWEGAREVADSLGNIGMADAIAGASIPNVRLPDMELPDVRAAAARLPDLRAAIGRMDAGRAASSIRDAVPEVHIGPRPSPVGAILGAVVVGFLAGLWVATWPVTAPRVRAALGELAARIGPRAGMTGRSAINRTDDWTRGPSPAGRPPMAPASAWTDSSATAGRTDSTPGVAVGPGRSPEGGLARNTSEPDDAGEWAPEASIANE